MSEWTQIPRYDAPPSSVRWALGWVWTLLQCRVLGHRFESYRTGDPGCPEAWELVETRFCLRCDDHWTRPVGIAIDLSAAGGTSTSSPSTNG